MSEETIQTLPCGCAKRYVPGGVQGERVHTCELHTPTAPPKAAPKRKSKK